MGDVCCLLLPLAQFLILPSDEKTLPKMLLLELGGFFVLGSGAVEGRGWGSMT